VATIDMGLKEGDGAVQNRLRWYGHELRKEDINWVKKCMVYEVEDSRPRGRPKRTWTSRLRKKIAKHLI